MAKPKYEQWLEKENLIKLEGWRRDGLSLEQIAHNMGINVSTLHTYINNHQEINNALKKGEEVAVYEVENALFKSARGYEVTESELTEVKDKDGETVQKILRQRKRYIAPSNAAQIFILKNKRPDRWRDKREIETPDTTPDDGFIKALKGTAAEDWNETDGV